MKILKEEKKIDLLTKYNVNEFDNISKEEIKFGFVAGREFNPDETITTEDIFQKLVQQEKKLNKLKELEEAVEDIVKVLKDEEERNNIRNELSSEKKKD